jgi:hypothetical protein
VGHQGSRRVDPAPLTREAVSIVLPFDSARVRFPSAKRHTLNPYAT